MANWKNETALVTEGCYGSGFWTWSIDFDLDALKDGKGEDAISVTSNHDTAGMSFSQYHGITRSYKLPDGVKVSAVQALIDDILARAEELTEGFSVEWNGNNHVGRWTFEDENDEYNDASMFWDELQDSIAELDSLMHYDLSEGDNVGFAEQAIKDHADFATLATLEGDDLEARIVEMFDDIYDAESDEWIYTGHSDAAQEIANRLINDREESED